GPKPVASGLLVHATGMSQLPSASSLKAYRSTNANMFLYWQLLQRAVQRGQGVFDFGRSSEDSATFRFKKQWGARPHKAIWQYYVRIGSIRDLRPETGKFQHFIRLWKMLPVQLTRWIGPPIVRGIP
ncbi:MAG: GNAT family N-acetyltransferase, partial [Planctomycetales bacterium]